MGHALLNLIGALLAGTGNVDLRARLGVVWAVGMLGALALLVSTFGIRKRRPLTPCSSPLWRWRTGWVEVGGSASGPDGW